MARELRTIGRAFTAEIEVYPVCKYTAAMKDIEEPTTLRYEVENWEIVTGEDAAEIEADMDTVDDLHEYLVLHLTNGGTATFRNSYCDMFRVR